MIRIVCRDEQISYTAYHLVKAFYPQEEAGVRVAAPEAQENGPESLPSRIRVEDGEGLFLEADSAEVLYQELCRQTERSLPWGMLTGVRPVKLADRWLAEHAEEYADPKEAKAAFIRYFYDTRFVTEEKAALAFDISFREQEILKEHGFSDGKGASLYVGIPFCPSVCRYCSFSSGPIGHYADRVEDYLQVLSGEMKQRKETWFAGDKCPDTIYIGGGTPTSLSETQLRVLLENMEQIFGVRQGLSRRKIREYTVEAGRPDSITRRKLQILKEYGVTRISVNPQTMNAKTLERIGRAHTPEQVREAFFLAREEGFDNINMDLIIGLDGESVADVRQTLQDVGELKPDSLTVHTLAIKRASAMGIERKLHQDQEWKQGVDIETMIRDAYQQAASMGMAPYYLYRQKMTAGNFENIGYALPGKEGLYNILIMEEIQSIIACGAGASTKIIWDAPVKDASRGGKMRKITRQENVKNIDEYIRRGSC